MATHRRIVSKEKSGTLYQTPAWATEALLKEEEFEGDILEPCCGKLAIVDVLRKHGYSVTYSDIVDYYPNQNNNQIIVDFFDIDDQFPNIITNPPFSIAEEVFHHAYKIAQRKICLLLRLAFLEGSGRYERIFKDNAPQRIYVFSERVTMYPDGEERASGGTTAYAWFVWDKIGKTPTTQVHWIKPGAKK